MFNKNNPFVCLAFLALFLLSTNNALQNTEASPLTASQSYPFQISNFEFNDMHIGKKYNYYQTDQRIFMMNQNMTITNFVEISIPDIIFAQQVCSKFVFNSAELYSISACKDLSDNTTYLVMISFLSSRPFYAHSLKTTLKGNIKMKLSGPVLVVQDEDEATGVSSKLHIFRVNLGSSIISSKPMEFVAYVDAEALGAKSLDISSFDVAEIALSTEEAAKLNSVASLKFYKIFIADKGYGLRTIDFTIEKNLLLQTASKEEFSDIISVAVQDCQSSSLVSTCNMFLGLNCNSIFNFKFTQGYASRGALNFISSQALPRELVIAGGLTLNKFVVAVAVKDVVANQSSLFFFRQSAGLKSLGKIAYQPLVLNGDNFGIDCPQDGICKAFVSSKTQNSIAEYKFGVASEDVIFTLTLTSTSTATKLPNTTFREWFFLFLAILGGLAILAYCTSKKDENTESEVAASRANEEGAAERTEGANTDNYRLLDEKNKDSLVSTPIARA